MASGEDREFCQPCATPSTRGFLGAVLGAVAHQQSAEDLHGCGEGGLEVVLGKPRVSTREACSLVMQPGPASANRRAGDSCATPWCGAGWEPALPVPPAGARAVWRLLGCSSSAQCLPSPGRCALPSSTSTLFFLGITQAMHLIAEKWKIFSAQLLEGLARIFPPSFHAVLAGRAPRKAAWERQVLCPLSRQWCPQDWGWLVPGCC